MLVSRRAARAALIAVSTAIAFMASNAQATTYTSVDLSSQFNINLSDLTDGGAYPTSGSIHVGGVPFLLKQYQGGLGGVFAAAGQSHSFDVNIPNATKVYVLVNSLGGTLGGLIGNIELQYTGPGPQTAQGNLLTEGTTVRDHYFGVFNNVATGISGTYGVNTPGHAHLDLLSLGFAISGPVTLTKIVLYGLDTQYGVPFIAGIAVAGPGVANTPIPGALPLLASALGGLGFIGWRRKRCVSASH
jgi:hypothetical protein